MCICDAIKQNESELQIANQRIEFKMREISDTVNSKQPIRVDLEAMKAILKEEENIYCFVQSLKMLFLQNQLPNLHGAFTKLKLE